MKGSLSPKYSQLITLFAFLVITSSIEAQNLISVNSVVKTDKDIKTGASQIAKYENLIKGKSIALVGNHSSKIGNTHLLDTLVALKHNVIRVMTPEHGFRGKADAGEKVQNSVDTKTGVSIVSLYGGNKKPLPKDMAGVEVVIFDIQDVGVRFYTYTSTMHYVMEACAENNVKMIVLDRPNPNGYYVDGPILDMSKKSFIGMHPVALVHGMTIGEYAKMINGEGWLKGGVKCDLTVIKCEDYSHEDFYELPVKPSPNLPNMTSVYLYPSLGLFEGTVMSIGRGTDKPFQIMGHPDFNDGEYKFTPRSMSGAKNPKHLGKECRGFDLTGFGAVYVKNIKRVYLYWLLEAYKKMNLGEKFFRSSFNLLAGNSVLKKQILEGKSEKEIRATWEPGLENFKKIRAKYLIYSDSIQ